jgi:hypothetical protein
MKHLKLFKLFESLTETNQISIDQFLIEIRIPENKRQQIVEWWNQNRTNIKIYYFPFSSPQPIAGVFLGTDKIAINSTLPMPPHVKLFLALHESRHCDQHTQGIFMEGYYNTVVNGDKESFLQTYTDSERDANDFAVQSMRECGFDSEMNFEEMRLRGNERAGDMVYRMMSNDIERLNPVDFFDLLKKQIGA